MAMIGAAPILTLFLPLFLSFSVSQGKQSWEQKYPFIKPASSFSSSSSSSSSGSGADRAYDYIIVGGGTAGCPLAATLSRNFSVLLLERGGVPFGNLNVSYMKNFHLSLADTSPTSASQAFASTDGVINSRGRVLGGGSSINAGFYSRANPRYVRKVGWDEKVANESFNWVEKQIVYRPKLAPWQKAVRDGLLEVGVSPFNGFSYDHLYGTKVGGTIFDHFGLRHSAAELLASATPENLRVLIHATVLKIVFDTTGNKPRAVGVLFKDEHGRQHQANLAGTRWSEVVLTAGAMGSPQLLMLSGVGPAAELRRLNIPAVLENEFVGKGMVDNPMNSVFVPSARAVEQSLIQTVGITRKGVYIEASSGFGQSQDSIRCNHGIFSAEIGQLSTIPPKQRTREAILAYTKTKKDLPHEAFKGGFILEKVANPKSTGHLTLTTTDVDENPSVTFNYFKHPYDLQRCVDGIRTVEMVLRSRNFTNFSQCDKVSVERLLNMSVKANVNLIPKHTNDSKSLEQFCKDTVITIWHYHGGCHVEKVVSPDYQVIGVQGLRVVDGSTFNQSPGTNPQATVMMMGRYMGVKILRERLGSSAGI
ncbi:hypothetical protein NMG60_11002471 [Bertholletia excelsa]